MTKSKTLTLISLAALVATPQFASANSHTTDKTSLSQSSTYSTVQQQSKPMKVVKQRVQREAVLSAGPTTRNVDGYQVQNSVGQTFTNRSLSAKELTQYNTNVRVIDVYEFTHNGKTYRNKIVEN